MNFEEHERKSLDCFEQTIGRYMDLNASANEEPVKNTEEKIYNVLERLESS